MNDDLYEYFEKELSEGKIDFSLRATKSSDGNITFYVHPSGKDGATLDVLLTPPDAE